MFIKSGLFFYKWIHEDFDFHIYFCLNHVSQSSNKADHASCQSNNSRVTIRFCLISRVTGEFLLKSRSGNFTIVSYFFQFKNAAYLSLSKGNRGTNCLLRQLSWLKHCFHMLIASKRCRFAGPFSRTMVLISMSADFVSSVHCVLKNFKSSWQTQLNQTGIVPYGKLLDDVFSIKIMFLAFMGTLR